MREKREVEMEIEADANGSELRDGTVSLEVYRGWRLVMIMFQSPMLALRHSGSLRHFTQRQTSRVFQRNKENYIQRSDGEC